MCAALLGALCAQDSSGSAAHQAWPNPGPRVSPSGHPEVLFTFDDGPHERYTERILETLARYEVGAIFYWTGYRVESRSKHRVKRRGLVSKVLDAGHLIGNHTVRHAHLCEVSKEKAAHEIDHNRALFDELARMPTFLFRAPYGDRCPQLDALLAERGIQNFHWDIDAREWELKSAEATAEHVITELKKLKGRAAILMHDTTYVTVKALPTILAWIKDENVRRLKNGRPVFRIISGSDLVEMTFELSLWSFASRTIASSTGRLAEVSRRLIPGAVAPRSAQIRHP